MPEINKHEIRSPEMQEVNPADGSWNEHLVQRRFGQDPVVLVELAWRERGLVVASGNEASIRDIASLRGKRVVPRQPEAGSQGLLQFLIEAEGLSPDDLVLTGLARTETDAALAVAEGKADAAFGLLGLAHQFRLGFVPLIRERFDLLVDRRSWFEPPMQRFSEFCRSDSFHQKAQDLRGYDVSGFGRIHFNGP